jgi:hypothetical protein
MPHTGAPLPTHALSPVLLFAPPQPLKRPPARLDCHGLPRRLAGAQGISSEQATHDTPAPRSRCPSPRSRQPRLSPFRPNGSRCTLDGAAWCRAPATPGGFVCARARAYKRTPLDRFSNRSVGHTHRRPSSSPGESPPLFFCLHPAPPSPGSLTLCSSSFAGAEALPRRGKARATEPLPLVRPRRRVSPPSGRGATLPGEQCCHSSPPPPVFSSRFSPFPVCSGAPPYPPSAAAPTSLGRPGTPSPR